MDKHLLVSRKDHNDKQSLLIQIDNEEKQLWALIHRKGPLHSDVEKLYCKVRSIYEEIIIDCNELEDLHDTEYSLWKLHYKHIDEFRKRAQKSSNGTGSTRLGVVQSVANVQRRNDNHRDGFNSFLSEASQFYQSLILKIRRCYGLPEEAVLYKEGGMYTTCAPETLRKCQFLCHRFFVCLGDLARYKELYGKPDAKKHNWSIASTHYLEATMIWPDSGNPHNQLAVLATYVSDEFLALYHCIRSLAVKEPFPDAWNNLILLFEKNRSSDLDLHPREACSDFGISSERITVHTKSQSSDDFGKSSLPGTKHDSSMKTNLWSLFVRTISFFFTKFSLDDFLCAFTSVMRELDVIMTLDETNLKSALESYKCMNSARKGPFRTLQVVSVFIFIFQNLVNILEQEDLEPESCEQQLVLVQWALMVIFTFMGHLVDRCLKASPSDCSPILPAILVFVEWLVGMVDKADKYATDVTDEKSTSAMSDFFSVLSDFLNQINISEGVVNSAENIPLWEHYELRGYAPAAGMHESLDFSTQCSDLNDYASTSECRIGRIVNAALKIASRASVSRKWICYEKLDRKFLIPQSSTSDLKVNEPHQHASKEIKECESHSLGENHCVNGRSIVMEEEEIILFEPLRRYNSVPLSASTTRNDPKSTGDTQDEPVPSDECLCHAASLLVAQSRDSSNPLSIQHKDPDSKCSKPLKQPGTSVNNTVAHPSSEASISAGPPSLSAWVINRGNLGMDKEKLTSDIFKYGLNTVEEEIASTSLSVSGISIGETEDAVTSHYSYSAPVPSAPLLPEDAVWFSGIPSDYPELGFGGVNNPYGYGGLQYPNSENDYVPGSKAVYPPLCGMTSSEWLRQYREHRNLEQASNHMQQAPDYASRSYGELREPDLIGRWGNPLASNPFMAPPPSFVPLYGKRFHGGYQAMTSTKKNG